jgi:WD40 repeat protein
MSNTRREALLFTAISAAQLTDAMDASASRRKVLILDCCYSGAFPAGRSAKADEGVHTLERFQGKGRAVLTASDAAQYAFEGDSLSGSGSSSVFTRYLVEAIRSGEADLDQDGDIALDELYSHVYEQVIAEMPQMRPKKLENVDGRILIARNVHWTLPAHLRHAVESPIATQRLNAVEGLAYLYRVGNPVVRATVAGHLTTLADDDSRSVSAAASAVLNRSQGAVSAEDVRAAHQSPSLAGEAPPISGQATASYTEGRSTSASDDRVPRQARPARRAVRKRSQRDDADRAAGGERKVLDTIAGSHATQGDALGKAAPSVSESASSEPTKNEQATAANEFPGRTTDRTPSAAKANSVLSRPSRRVVVVAAVVRISPVGVVVAYLIARTPTSPEWVRTLSGHTGNVYSVAVTADGRIVSGSDDHTVRVWDLATGKLVRILTGHTGAVYSVVVTEDGRIVSGSSDDSVRVWDLATGRLVRTLTDHTEGVDSLAVTGDGRIVGSADNGVQVWDLATGTWIQTLTGHTKPVYEVAVTPDGTQALSGSLDDTVRVWDLASGEEVRRVDADIWGAVAVTPDGEQFLGVGLGEVYVWDLSTGEMVDTLYSDVLFIEGVAVTPDGQRVICACNDVRSGHVTVWSSATGQGVDLTGHTEEVQAVAVTSNGRQVVSGSLDDTVRVWNMPTRSE